MSSITSAPSQTVDEAIKYDPNKNFYKQDPLAINWNEQNPDILKQQIASNIQNVYGPNQKGTPNYDPSMPTCEKPTPITSDKIFDTASNLAQQLGANQECIKSTQNQMKQSGESAAFDQRAASNSDFTKSTGFASGSSASSSEGQSQSASSSSSASASAAAQGSVGWGAASFAASAKASAEHSEMSASSASKSAASSQSASGYDTSTGASMSQSSNTGSTQSSSASQDASSLQKGCGSIMITAANMAQKSMAMQCVLNSIASEGAMTVGMQATIIVKTLPLSDAEIKSKADMQAQYAMMTNKNAVTVQALTMALLAQPIPTPPPTMTSPVDIDNFNKNAAAMFASKIDAVTSFYAKQEKAFSDSLNNLYDRSITMKQTQMINKTTSSVKYVQSITTSAKSDLATLAASAQKDAVAQKMANDLGVSAQDPNIKSMSQTACETNSSTSSSNMTNLLNKMKMDVSAGNTINITSAGRILLENVVLNNEVALDLAVQSIMNQANDNAMHSAAQALTETSNSNEVANKVAGLDATQKAMGDANAAAINAANAPIAGSQAAATAAQQAFADRSKAQSDATAAIAAASFEAGSKGATAGLGATTAGLVGATAGLNATGAATTGLGASTTALNAADDVAKMQAASSYTMIIGVIVVVGLLFVLYKVGLIGGNNK